MTVTFHSKGQHTNNWLGKPEEYMSRDVKVCQGIQDGEEHAAMPLTPDRVAGNQECKGIVGLACPRYRFEGGRIRDPTGRVGGRGGGLEKLKWLWAVVAFALCIKLSLYLSLFSLVGCGLPLAIVMLLLDHGGSTTRDGSKRRYIKNKTRST